mmetsp:Transcript_1979/g.4698  ORF Transcript_1979/g.4698 Transcript_1979/m.4698 type:complete len:200 (-) Transcript_1979:337-936(-)
MNSVRRLSASFGSNSSFSIGSYPLPFSISSQSSASFPSATSRLRGIVDARTTKSSTLRVSEYCAAPGLTHARTIVRQSPSSASRISSVVVESRKGTCVLPHLSASSTLPSANSPSWMAFPSIFASSPSAPNCSAPARSMSVIVALSVGRETGAAFASSPSPSTGWLSTFRRPGKAAWRTGTLETFIVRKQCERDDELLK